MTKVSLLAAHRAVISEAVEAKTATVENAKAALLDAHALYEAGNDKSREGDEMANLGATALFNGQCEGTITKEETSAIMGQVFGYKMKPDGTASKTPAGKGEVIRKRIVRAVQAAEYIGGGECPKFLDGVDMGDVQAVMAEFEAGHVSIFTAYDKLGGLKEKATVHPAYNPSTIGKIAAELAKPEAMERIAKSPELLALYGAIQDAFDGWQVEKEEADKLFA